MTIILGMAVDHIKKRVSPILAVSVIAAMLFGSVAIWSIISLAGMLFAGAPAGQPASAVSQQSDEQQKKEQAKQAAVDFTNRWISASAVSALDSRAIAEVRKAVEGIRLSRFDGNATSLGDNTITVFDTGAQYPVYDFEVRPVMYLGSQFAPVTLKLSVAKDSNKVISVLSSQF